MLRKINEEVMRPIFSGKNQKHARQSPLSALLFLALLLILKDYNISFSPASATGVNFFLFCSRRSPLKGAAASCTLFLVLSFSLSCLLVLLPRVDRVSRFSRTALAAIVSDEIIKRDYYHSQYSVTVTDLARFRG